MAGCRKNQGVNTPSYSMIFLFDGIDNSSTRIARMEMLIAAYLYVPAGNYYMCLCLLDVSGVGGHVAMITASQKSTRGLIIQVEPRTNHPPLFRIVNTPLHFDSEFLWDMKTSTSNNSFNYAMEHDMLVYTSARLYIAPKPCIISCTAILRKWHFKFHRFLFFCCKFPVNT